MFSSLTNVCGIETRRRRSSHAYQGYPHALGVFLSLPNASTRSLELPWDKITPCEIAK